MREKSSVPPNFWYIDRAIQMIDLFWDRNGLLMNIWRDQCKINIQGHCITAQAKKWDIFSDPIKLLFFRETVYYTTYWKPPKNKFMTRTRPSDEKINPIRLDCEIIMYEFWAARSFTKTERGAHL